MQIYFALFRWNAQMLAYIRGKNERSRLGVLMSRALFYNKKAPSSRIGQGGYSFYSIRFGNKQLLIFCYFFRIDVYTLDGNVKNCLYCRFSLLMHIYLCQLPTMQSAGRRFFFLAYCWFSIRQWQLLSEKTWK